ncbi:antitoxin [Streptomyces sp. YIM B13518]|uniref:antitoxin n=1 Tax=Streptomyces sp. YIM B13518 TaxID=3366316 RepID=UPI0036BE30C4
MGILDKFKSSRSARDKAGKASDAAQRKMNERTGGKHRRQSDTGQQHAEHRFGVHRGRPGRP